MGIYWIMIGVLLFLSSLYTVLSAILTVDSGTVAFVFRFRKFNRALKPGLNFLIPFIERTEIHSTATHQVELPDEPENIDRVSEVAPPGKKLPFRVPHKGMEEAIFYVKKEYDEDRREGDPFDNTRRLRDLKKVRFAQLPNDVKEALQADSLNAPLTSEVAAVFEWHLKADDEKNNWADVRNFVENVNPEGGRDREGEVKKRAEDMVARILQEYLAPTTLGHAIEMSALFSRLIKDELEALVGEEATHEREVERKTEAIERPWGIHIGEAFLKPFHAGKTINAARSDAGAAVSNKFTTIRNAEAAAESIRRDAEAKADATRMQADADREKEIKKGEGEAGRIAAMAAVWKNNPSAQSIAELDVKERGYEAYEKNAHVTTYAPGADAILPLGK